MKEKAGIRKHKRHKRIKIFLKSDKQNSRSLENKKTQGERKSFCQF